MSSYVLMSHLLFQNRQKLKNILDDIRTIVYSKVIIKQVFMNLG